MKKHILNEEILRIKKIMGLNINPLLNHNLIQEQDTNYLATKVAEKLIRVLSYFWDDDETEALNAIREINSYDVYKRVSEIIKSKKGKTLEEYINSEMSDVDWQYEKIFDHLTLYNKQAEDQYNSNAFLRGVGKGIDAVTFSKSEDEDKPITPAPVKVPNIESPNGVESRGPFVSEGNTQSYNAPPKALYPFQNNTVIYDEENVANFIYTIKNISNKKIKINDIQVADKRIKIIPSLKELEPKSTSYLYCEYSILNDPLDKSMFNSKIKPVADNTRVVKNYPIDRNLVNVEKNIEKLESIKNDIIVKTDLGDVKIDIKFDHNEITKKAEYLKKLYNERKSFPIELPNGKMSEGGHAVPEYFSPFNFDEFLYYLDEIVKKTTGECAKYVKEYYNKYFNYVNEQTPGIVFDLDQLKNKRARCLEEVTKLYNKYANEKFPHGIVEDDYEFFKEEYYSAKTAVSRFEENNKTLSMSKEGGWVFKKDYLSAEKKKEYEALTKKLEEVQYFWGYDERSDFEKWMDDWAFPAQVGAMVVLFIAGFFTEGVTWTAMGEVWTWGRVATTIDVVLNAGIGIHFLGRGKTQESLIAFLFCFLPQLHGLYDMVKLRIGVKAYTEIGLSLVEKVSKSGLDLSVRENAMAFMGLLTKTERAVFRTIARADASLVERELAGLGNKVRQLRGLYGQIPWSTAQKVVRGVSKFSRNMFVDMAITIPAVKLMYNAVKAAFMKYKIDITWGERDGALVKFLANNKTKEEIGRLEKNIIKIAAEMTEKQRKWFADNMEEVVIENEQELSSEDQAKVEQAKNKIVQQQVEAEKQKLNQQVKSNENLVIDTASAMQRYFEKYADTTRPYRPNN